MPAGMDPVIEPAAPSSALPAGKVGGKAACDAAPAAPSSEGTAAGVGHTPAKAGRSAGDNPPSLAGLSLGSPAGGPETPAPRAPGPAPAASDGGASPANAGAGDDLLASPPRPGAARRGLSFPATGSPSPPEVLAAAAAMSPLPSRPGLGVARAGEAGTQEDGDTSAGAPFVEPLLDPSDDRFTMYPIKCVLLRERVENGKERALPSHHVGSGVRRRAGRRAGRPWGAAPDLFPPKQKTKQNAPARPFFCSAPRAAGFPPGPEADVRHGA